MRHNAYARANVGDVERLVRICLGTYLSWLGHNRLGGSGLGKLVHFWGVDLAVSGITGWCWGSAVLGISSVPGAANNPYERLAGYLRKTMERARPELRRAA